MPGSANRAGDWVYNKIMHRPEIRQKIEHELSTAAGARSQGFEGRARVCARRAVGAAIRAYFEQRGLGVPGSSAMDLLRAYRALPGLPNEQAQVVDHFLMQVDTNFSLPAEVDLLADARWLVEEIFQTTGDEG